jgi:signal transduction histidine kinase
MKKSGAGNGTKFRDSLLFRYMMIVLLALLFLPVVVSALSILFTLFPSPAELKYGSSDELQTVWHAEARRLDGADAAAVNARLRALKQRYADATLFWVDGEGRTRLQLPERGGLPETWTADEAIRFMKRSVDADPFTVVAFFGPEEKGPGFMVLQMPRAFLNIEWPVQSYASLYFGLMLFMFVAFVVMSWLFFRNIRRRLVRLEAAMARTDEDGLPAPVAISRPDEIGRLEHAFGVMADRLRKGREREREEEKLRKQLISSLSHDLRTPLTVIRSHVHLLGRERLSAQGAESVKQLEAKTETLGALIDNLFAYTLMTSGKYPLRIETCDIVRLVRQSAATWYPLWEKEGIEAEIELDGVSLVWKADRNAFLRVLDNLFQNVVRHARSGGYIGIRAQVLDTGIQALVISDRGPGMQAKSDAKGGGIGLAIVDHLLREMKLERRTDSDEGGTRIAIWPSREHG